MSNGFKLTISIISLVFAITSSAAASLGVAMTRAWGGDCYGATCSIMQFVMFLGPISLVFFIAFIKTKKDSYFWLSIAPFILLIVLFIFTR